MRWQAGVAALALATGAQAQTQIELLQQSYSTSLSATLRASECYNGCPVTVANSTNNLSSFGPIADSLVAAPQTYAKASTSPFSLTVDASALPRLGAVDPDEINAHSFAIAESQLSFKALASGPAPLTLAFGGDGSWRSFTSGEVSLLDTTTGLSLYDFSWGQRYSGGFPFNTGPFITLEEFDASHLYSLSMKLYASANIDWSSAYINLAGLTIAPPVPEPSQVALAIAGLLGVGALARRRRG